MMVAVTILSLGVLSVISGFSFITRSVQNSKSKSIAFNLAQEKIESLKNVAYFRILVTTNPQTESAVSPSFLYDGPTGYYPPEIPLTVGDIAYDRRVYVHYVREASGGDLAHVDYTGPDSGLKEVRVYVLWREGPNWKHVSVRNLRDDPDRLATDSTLSGNIDDALGADVAGAEVEVIQNAAWNAKTGSDGNYSFQVAAGTYTLRASSSGYFSAVSAPRLVASGGATSTDLVLVKMASGTISGRAYIRDHLVISQVVASTVSGADNLEYVELYNPTTWTWTLSDAAVDLRYVDANNVLVTDIALNFRTAEIAANGGYYLVANTGTVVAAGTAVAADAVYATLLQNVIRDGKAGGLMLTNDAATRTYDKVGWSKNADIVEPSAPAQAVEGVQVTLANGLGAGEQIVRSSEVFNAIDSPSGTHAWDSGVNGSDFNVLGYTPQDESLVYGPKNSTTIHAPKGGTPAAGAIAFADDGLSVSAAVDAGGVFALADVATGTWTLTVSSGSRARDTASVAVAAGATTAVGALALSSDTPKGYVTGTVKDGGGAALAAIQISAPGSATTSDAAGNFRLTVTTGTVQVVANPGNANASYVSQALSVATDVGTVAPNTDFTLSRGAKLRGFSTSNGTAAFPGLVVVATLDDAAKGTAVSGTDGYFTISDLSTGSYVITAQPSSGETPTPSTFTNTIALAQAGLTLFVGTFTVSNALGAVAGTVKENGAAIKTGVLVVVTSATIVSDPPTLNSALRSGSVLYFNASSGADGTYSVSAPGGYTYNVYSWYTNAAGSTVRKSGTAVVSAAATTTVNLAWP